MCIPSADHILNLGPDCPLGNDELPYVQCANKMVARVMMLLLVLKFLNCTFVLEQPSGSLCLSCSNSMLILSVFKLAIVEITLVSAKVMDPSQSSACAIVVETLQHKLQDGSLQQLV